MGEQISKEQHFNYTSNGIPMKDIQFRLNCKTKFQYIHPIKCENQQNISLEEEQFHKNQEIDLQTHEAEYWEIQNTLEESSINSAKQLQTIQQVKVKWNSFIKMKRLNYLEDYSVLKQIGRGGFGCVHKVKARYTGLYRAAKRIKKSQLKKSQHEKLFQEMAIMMSLDHPNIAKLYEVYDYKSYYVLILELCEGGELFKKIVTKQIKEDSAAKVMKQILRTLIYLHKHGIVHRDLKPQNMLFQTDSDTLKLIDFGIAVKKKPNQVLNARLGTPYYIAPQVLCKNYNQKCDIWSAGVILFMMIAGFPPFRGDNQFQVMESVLRQSVIFKGPVWSKVSSSCMNILNLMLKKNPEERPSAQQLFNHPWIQKVVQNIRTDKQQKVISNIRGFSFQNKLQAVVYTYIVSQLLTSDQKKHLFQIFKELDKNNDGVIECSQLKVALAQKKQIGQDRISFLMRIIDTNGSGHIDYTQFLVAGLNAKQMLNQSHFQQAFQYFDIDHSGNITFEEIVHFLEDTKESQESIKKIFKQVDQNGDGNISKQEFVRLLMRQTKKRITSLTHIKDDPQFSKTGQAKPIKQNTHKNNKHKQNQPVQKPKEKQTKKSSQDSKQQSAQKQMVIIEGKQETKIKSEKVQKQNKKHASQLSTGLKESEGVVGQSHNQKNKIISNIKEKTITGGQKGHSKHKKVVIVL